MRATFSLAALTLLTAPVWAQSPPTASTATNTVTQAEYQNLVRQSEAAFRKTPDAAQKAASTAQRLSLVHHVRLPNGRLIDVDTTHTVNALRRRAAAKPGARPDAIDTAREQTLRVMVAPEDDETGDALREDPAQAATAVLARSEFQYAPPKPTAPTWLERMGAAFRKWWEGELRAFGRWLSKLFSRSTPRTKPVTGLEAFASFVKYFLIGIAIIAAVVGLTFLALKLYRDGNLKGLGRRRNKNTGPLLDATEEEMRDPLTSAHLLAERGEFRGAVRLVYIASLKRLGEAGLLTLEKNRTNGEYQRALRGRSRVAYEELLPATRLFDRVWYGRQQATRPEYESLIAVHNRLPATPAPAAESVGGDAR